MERVKIVSISDIRENGYTPAINQRDREAFSADKYGQNFLGVLPQGRADYAFLQYILKSLDKDTGRCAIFFPHGVLFRNEGSAMREKLVRSDAVDTRPVQECYDAWCAVSEMMKRSYAMLNAMLGEEVVADE